VLLDRKTLSEDGTVVLSGLSISEDGKLMAYGLFDCWVRLESSGCGKCEDLPDHLKWIKFSAALTDDNQGFFYSRYDEPNERRN